MQTIVIQGAGLEPGDVNGDLHVDLADGILVLQVLSGLTPDPILYRSAEVNGDGMIGLDEAIHILQGISDVR